MSGDAGNQPAPAPTGTVLPGGNLNGMPNSNGQIKMKAGDGHSNASNKPKRPLTAYNTFFKDERDKLLSDEIPSSDTGTMGFLSLAKTITQRWKELPPDEVETYKTRAEEDMKRYLKEMEAYDQKGLEQSPPDEKLVDEETQKQRECLVQSRDLLEKLVDEETKKRYFGDAGNGGS